jgi:hypothetical protein
VTTQIRLYLEIAAAIVLAIAVGLFVHHERAVGAEKINTADAKALQAAQRQADAQTQLNLERAAKADAGAISAQKAVDDYRASHPEQPIRLCHADSSVPGVSKGSPTNQSPPSSGAGPATVREVQSGTVGADIGPSLDALVQAASRLAVLYSNQQQR